MSQAVYQPGMQPYAQHAGVDLTPPVRSISKPLIVLLGIRAATPVFGWIVFRIYNAVSPFPGRDAPGDEVRAALESRRTLDSVLTGIDGLLTLVGIIMFFVWLARVYAWIRATRGPTKYSTGWAIGSWFVPIANLFVPALAISDAVKKGANGENGGLVPVFWIAWLVATWSNMMQALIKALSTTPGLNPSDFRFLFENSSLIYWLNFASEVVAYGSLLVIVKTVTKHAIAPRPAM
ncbi:MAG: DUF4328 domain-containing protein [Polyangiaceae bacterium]|nr:DUF4328 domain-containing protein [Polyangiaceae bacterium]